MLYTKKIPIIITAVLIILYLLNFIGIIDLNLSKLIALFLVFSGFSFSVILIGTGKKINLFLSAVAFSIGLIMLLYDSFLFADSATSLIPSAFYTVSIGLIVIYLDDLNKKILLYLSIFLIVLGSLPIYLNRTITLELLYFSFLSVVKEYLLILGFLLIVLAYAILKKK